LRDFGLTALMLLGHLRLFSRHFRHCCSSCNDVLGK
jgi:hypothetical protein